jgi:hypothetical protein
MILKGFCESSTWITALVCVGTSRDRQRLCGTVRSSMSLESFASLRCNPETGYSQLVVLERDRTSKRGRMPLDSSEMT